MSGERFDARLLDDIWLKPVGTVATADHAPGDTTLYVQVGGDLQDWDPDGDEPLEMIRGYLLITPADVADADPVDPFVVAYWDWEGELDEQEYVVLAAGLPAPVPTGSTVWVWSPDLEADPTGTVGEVVSEWVGPVMRDDEESSAEDDDRDTLILPDLVDTLSAANVPAGGIPVIVQTLESFYGPDKAQELGVTGDDDKYVTTVIGGDLVRDGNKTPMTVDAFDRTLGRKGGIFRTSPAPEPRAEMDADIDGGFFRIVGAMNRVMGSLKVLLEEGKQWLVLSTGGSDPTRIRLRNDTDGRFIDFLAERFTFFGTIATNNGLVLARGDQRIRGIDGNQGVERNTGGNGLIEVVHLVGAGAIVHAQLRGAGASKFHLAIDSTTSEVARWVVRWRAGNDEGQPANSLATQQLVTFDWTAHVIDR